MIQDTAWSPRFVASTTATAATSADVNAGTDTNKFITPAALAGSTPTLTLTDAILGTSGPSVKSTLSARAPRQGLVFDGTAGATVGGPTLNTDYTVLAWIRPTEVTSFQALVADSAGTFIPLYIQSGSLKYYGQNGVKIVTGGTLTAGKSIMVAVTRSTNTVQLYADGVASGASDTDSTAVTAAIANIGSAGSSFKFAGSISGALIYNRALSAAEVVALYEAGAPSGADYNSASNTSVVTAAWTDSATYTTFSSASASTFTAVKASGTGYSGLSAALASSIRVGQRFLVTGTLTLNNGKTVQPRVYLDNTAELQIVPVGAFSITLTATAANGGFSWTSTGDADYTISGISITRLGLLLAPDAAQAGGGLTWYDTSGNAANISWNSGVSWNVPTSQKTASGWTYGGNLTVSSSSAYLKLASTGSSNTWDLFSDSNGSFYLSQSGVVNALRVFPTTGNFSIGAGSSDLGQKLQVNGTIYASSTITSGGMRFGQNGSGYGEVSWSTLFGTGNYALLQGSGGDTYLNSGTGQGLSLRTNGNTTALTLDASQNATFAGGIIGMTQGNVDNISDDGVASFTPLYNRGFIVINNPDYSQNALIAYFKSGSSYLLYSITKSADVTLNNSTTLTGTTGTDGKLNIGYNNSIIYIENRLGGTANFQRYALGGTNN